MRDEYKRDAQISSTFFYFGW